jgi:predicted RNA polymerase sigma factor
MARLRSRGSGLSDEPKLVDYHLLPAAPADLLARAGLTAEALVALDAAVALAPAAQDRRQLAKRRDELAGDIERGVE